MTDRNLIFIADHNVGTLTRQLRMMGFDTKLFTGENDAVMVETAAAEDRIILTRDTGVMARRLIISGKIKAILIESDRLEEQTRQVIETLQIPKNQFKPFSLCIECNAPLLAINKAAVQDRVPPYVFQTQERFFTCPVCRRIYWQGTHWQAMTRKLGNVIQ